MMGKPYSLIINQAKKKQVIPYCCTKKHGSISRFTFFTTQSPKVNQLNWFKGELFRPKLLKYSFSEEEAHARQTCHIHKISLNVSFELAFVCRISNKIWAFVRARFCMRLLFIVYTVSIAGAWCQESTFPVRCGKQSTATADVEGSNICDDNGVCDMYHMFKWPMEWEMRHFYLISIYSTIQIRPHTRDTTVALFS